MQSNPRPVVLVAEDHPVNQKVVALLLGSLGVDGQMVSNGKDAVEAAVQSSQPDGFALILMDIMMPEMDGFEAAQTIRRREFSIGRHTPIIACTAMDRDGIKDQCIRAGMDDYMGKPMSKASMRAIIERWSNIPIHQPPTVDSAELKANQLAESVIEQLEPIDRRSLDLLYGLEQLDDILVLFQTVTETLLVQLESAIKRQDVILVRHMAHEIKGSSYAVSASEMATVCLALEQAGELQNWPEVERLYAALGLAFARVGEYMAGNQRIVRELRHDTSFGQSPSITVGGNS